jgi:formate hydrogenlyase transcriptional activator
LTSGPTLDAPLSQFQCVSEEMVSEPTTLEDVERSHIRRILEETKGRLAPAAELLGVPRTTLFYMVRRLGIDPRRGEMSSTRLTPTPFVSGIPSALTAG